MKDIGRVPTLHIHVTDWKSANTPKGNVEYDGREENGRQMDTKIEREREKDDID